MASPLSRFRAGFHRHRVHRRRFLLGIAAPLPLLLGGCGPAAPPPDSEVLLPAPPAPAPAPRSGDAKAAAKKGAKPSAAAALTPLATPQQVVGAVDLGRLDPFGALPPALPSLLGPDGRPLPPSLSGGMTAAQRAAAARRRSRPAPLPPLQLPEGFSVSGVIRSGGVSEAVVSYGALSGSVRPGDHGGRTTDLLPSGWSVAAIDVNRGLLTLQKGPQRVTAEL
jgi:hypothetical protein